MNNQAKNTTFATKAISGTERAWRCICRMLRMLRVFRILKLTAYMREYRALGEALHASRRRIFIFIGTVAIRPANVSGTAGIPLRVAGGIAVARALSMRAFVSTSSRRGTRVPLPDRVGLQALFGTDGSVYGANSPEFGLQFPPSPPTGGNYSAATVIGCARPACAMRA